MTFSAFWRLLRSWWILAVVGPLAGVGAAAAWIVLTPPSYEATAQVLVDVRAPETVGNQFIANQLASDYVTTQFDILRSNRLAVHVADLLAKSSSSTASAVFEDEDVRNLTLIPAVGSRVISIRYSAPGPEEAAIIANAFAKAYADISLELQAEPARESTRWYDQRLVVVREQLRQAQERLIGRQRELGITADQDGQDSDSARLANLTGQLASAEAAQASLSTRTQGAALPDTLLSPVARGIQGDLARLEAQRHLLTAYAGPNNLDVVQLDRQISTLRSKFSEEQALTRLSAQISANQAGSSVEKLIKAVSDQKGRVVAARASRSAVATLQQDVDNLKTTYEQIVSRRSQLGLLGQGSGTNVTLLSPATPPVLPAWPKPAIMLAAGLIFGSVVTMLIIVAAGLANPRLLSGAEFEELLGIRYLGTVRGEQKARSKWRRKAKKAPLAPIELLGESA